MNIFEKILCFLQGEMVTPIPYGWFHLLCMCITFIIIIVLFVNKKNHCEKQLKIILGVYSIIAFLFELLKQLIWAFNYDFINNTAIWDYEWYSFPFQLCTTPIYVCLICLFLKKGKIRDFLLSYIAYVTILGSFVTMIIPNSCFTSDILVNIHTMWLHLGSLVVSIYLFISKEVEISLKNLKYSISVFLIFVCIAQFLNIFVYHLGVLNGETYNMFYISPYFISSLPVFDVIQQSVPYVIYLLTYIFAISIGAFIVFCISFIIKKYFGSYLEIEKK